MRFTRRTMLQLTAFSPALRPLLGQAPPQPRSTVAVIQGEDRRKNIAAALEAIDDQIGPALRAKKYVVIKPNFVSTTNQLAATHANAVHGILDYLEPRFKGPVMVAEASAGDTMEAFEEFRFGQIASEHKPLKVDLVDLNREARYVTIPLIDYDLHAKPARLGAPLHSAPGVTPAWNDKRVTHNGLRQTHYNIFLTAQAMKPFWGATVIDGYEGMEGNGPASGTPVASRVAIASRDYIAADRVGIEVMGLNPKWLGYLNFCGDFGIGQYDLSKIDIRGAKLAAVRRKFRLHPDIERELEWMGPMEELPRVVG